jgi:transcription antitermination factor NusG
MDTALNTFHSTAAQVSLPVDCTELRWYAAYTRSQHEKRVAQQLAERAIERYLPLYQAVHRWKDRRKRVDLPLFPGYVFVRIHLQNRLEVLRVPSVVRLVGFNGAPTALPDGEVEHLRCALAEGLRAVPHPYLSAGSRVRVMNGPLEGMEGTVVRRKNRTRFILSFDVIMRSVAVEVDEIDLATSG